TPLVVTPQRQLPTATVAVPTPMVVTPQRPLPTATVAAPTPLVLTPQQPLPTATVAPTPIHEGPESNTRATLPKPPAPPQEKPPTSDGSIIVRKWTCIEKMPAGAGQDWFDKYCSESQDGVTFVVTVGRQQSSYVT